VIYENGAAKLWQTEAGYVSMNDSKYHYYLQDHQGNNRVVVSETGATEEVNHYYAFGGLFDNSNSVQPFKYNGKELDTKKGLNWYDYGARQYDATLGRWFVVDPLAEDYYSWSPYNYCTNNPINFIDPNGNGVETVWDFFNVLLGAKSFGENIDAGNYGAAIFDGVGVLLDAAAAVLPFVPGGVSSGIKFIRKTDDTFDVVNISTKSDNTISSFKNADAIELEAVEITKPYTKSNLKLGQKMHKDYHLGEFGKEFQLPSHRRIDFLDIENKTIYELKPFNPRAMKQGEKQLQKYKEELENIPRFKGWKWNTKLETY
jgi:RHS repeat-associated protein